MNPTSHPLLVPSSPSLSPLASYILSFSRVPLYRTTVPIVRWVVFSSVGFRRFQNSRLSYTQINQYEQHKMVRQSTTHHMDEHVSALSVDAVISFRCCWLFLTIFVRSFSLFRAHPIQPITLHFTQLNPTIRHTTIQP